MNKKTPSSTMTDNARMAFRKLKERGVPVIDRAECFDGDDANTSAQFVLIAKSDHGDECFADMSGDWIKETWVNGEYINPLGIRQDVHEILTEHRLFCEWYDGGCLYVYDVSSDPTSNSKTDNKEDGTGSSPPRMSSAAFSAMKALARIGAPVWDFHSYSHVYNPTTLRPGIQFVMTCEPKYDIFFADPSDAISPWFEDSEGLAPQVATIITKYGLNHHHHVHVYDEPKFRPKDLIAFSDPAASPRERGTS